MVGKKVPDFTAPAYHNNTFTNEKLSGHLEKWGGNVWQEWKTTQAVE